MPAQILLYIRETADGRAVVVPVDFPDLGVDARSVGAARKAVTSKLISRLRTLSPVQRDALEDRFEAALELVTVEVATDDEEVLALPVGLVVTVCGAGRRLVHLVRAPTIANFSLTVRRREEVTARAATKLAGLLSKMPTAAALATQEVDGARLDWTVVELPEQAEPPGSAGASSPQAAPNPLEEFGVILSRTAPGPPGSFDLREGLVERVLAALATPGRSSVVLVGPRDVGKTALVREIARRLVAGAVPPALAGAELWRISAVVPWSTIPNC